MLSQAKLKEVAFTGGFLYDRTRINRTVTLKTEYEQLKQTGRLYCSKMDWKAGMPNQPHFFWDSDVAKWIEACAYSLASEPDALLEQQVDDIIDIMENSQQEDGYLNSYYQTVEPENRFTNLQDNHELYCAGHLIEAAVSYYLITKKDKFLKVMIRYADLLCTVFGKEEGKLRGYPGHEEIELALVKLYEVTSHRKYLDLAEFFVLERGKQPHYYDIEREKAASTVRFYDHHIPALKKYAYVQAHVPLIQQDKIEGHAVRALYFLSGAADVAYRTGNKELIAACHRLYENTVNQRMYLTGGVGSSLKIENFSFDYDLPNDIAYAETCASIALAFFAHRLFLHEKKGKYMDTFEQALYNGILSGMSLDGTEFFYSNPLEVNKKAVDYDTLGLKSNMGYKRKKWFGCACCPPNIARLLASLGQYVYAVEHDDIFVNLYADSTFTHHGVTLVQKTNYPWEEEVSIRIKIETAKSFKVALRIPSWCKTFHLKVNGHRMACPVTDGYLFLEREFKNDDDIKLTLSMPVVKVQSHPKIRQNSNKIALKRGPVVYCLEQVDNKADLFCLYLSKEDKFMAVYDHTFLGGCAFLEGTLHQAVESDKKEPLYSPLHPLSYEQVKVTAVPYCLWTNRYPGDMIIWINKLCRE